MEDIERRPWKPGLHGTAPEDCSHKLAASAFSDRRQHEGRPEGSLEQAQSQDLDRGRNLRQDGHGKRIRSESPNPHND